MVKQVELSALVANLAISLLQLELLRLFKIVSIVVPSHVLLLAHASLEISAMKRDSTRGESVGVLEENLILKHNRVDECT